MQLSSELLDTLHAEDSAQADEKSVNFVTQYLTTLKEIRSSVNKEIEYVATLSIQPNETRLYEEHKLVELAKERARFEHSA